MAAAFYVVLVAMLTTYAVLDGFDLGAGIMHLLVARGERERRSVLAAIAPVWDGNEVWLIAFGGVLFLAFPKAYAAGFSGFYLPLMIILWLLILRGIAIELRNHHVNPLWGSLWDAVFALSSALLAFLFGVAMGNLVRGTRLGEGGYFATPLFATFLPGPRAGVLDAYTVLVGLLAAALLGGHGALYLALRTEGALQERCQRAARWAFGGVILLGLGATAATFAVQPVLLQGLRGRPWAWPLVLGIPASLGVLFYSLGSRGRSDLRAFLSSAACIACVIGASAAGLYPNLLLSAIAPAYHLTVANAAAGEHGLRVGLVWWAGAAVLVVGSFVFLYRTVRGKVDLDGGH